MAAPPVAPASGVECVHLVRVRRSVLERVVSAGMRGALIVYMKMVRHFHIND